MSPNSPSITKADEAVRLRDMARAGLRLHVDFTLQLFIVSGTSLLAHLPIHYGYPGTPLN